MAALTFKVGGDTSGLKRALAGAEGMMKGLAGAAKRVALGGFAAGAVGVTTALVGMNKALSLGGRLSDVAANTGLLAGEALILEQALREAGISGEKLQPTIQKMQKSIVEAGDGLQTPLRAFEALGLKLEELEAMKPGEQFAAVQEALAGVADPAERSARAMQIFGRSGGELGALFSNPDAMKNAAEAVGGQAEMLTKGAASFDRSADILGNVGAKIRGFFVGMVSYVNPVLLPVLEEMNKLDFAKYGAAAGKAISMIVLAFKEDSLPGLLKDGLVIAAGGFINHMSRGLQAMMRGLWASLSQIPRFFKMGLAVLGDSRFWTGLAGMISGMMGKLKDSLTDALVPDALKDDSWEAARKASEWLNERISQVGRDRMDEVLSENVVPQVDKAAAEIREAFRKGYDAEDLWDVSGNRAARRETLGGLEKILDARKAEAEAVKEVKKAEAVVPKVPEEDEGGIFGGGVMKPVVSSLGRIGGAALRGAPANRMDVERNRLLRKIAENTGRPSLAVYA